MSVTFHIQESDKKNNINNYKNDVPCTAIFPDTVIKWTYISSYDSFHNKGTNIAK
jgi:hypothetical protein